MKVKLLFLISFLTFSLLNANASKIISIQKTEISDYEQPKFPGGDEKLKDYITKNLRYPVTARENKIEGTVYISFIVEADGTLSNIQITQDIGHGCGEAAMELVKSMPKWKSGKQNGEFARMGVNLPIKFVLEK